jgi:hypothetical protein
MKFFLGWMASRFAPLPAAVLVSAGATEKMCESKLSRISTIRFRTNSSVYLLSKRPALRLLADSKTEPNASRQIFCQARRGAE